MLPWLPCLILLVFLVLGHLIILATSHWIFLMGFLVWRGRSKVMSWIGDWVITFGLIGVLLLIYIFHLSALVKENIDPTSGHI